MSTWLRITATEKTDVYRKVTDAIINAIESGIGEYRMPWIQATVIRASAPYPLVPRSHIAVSTRSCSGRNPKARDTLPPYGEPTDSGLSLAHRSDEVNMVRQ